MPRMSGFEFLSVVRRRFPQILTVAMSGAYQELPFGVIADGFYAKGEHPKKLFKAIEQLLGAGGTSIPVARDPSWNELPVIVTLQVEVAAGQSHAALVDGYDD
jgi:DNA-binding NarL/FixJ family response regulator